jgi:hypothetical protein
MDPYLEVHWGDVHTSLITYARDALRVQLPPDLRARVEEYVAIESDNGAGAGFFPDVRVIESPRRTTHAAPGGGVAVAEPILVPMYVEPRTERRLTIIDTKSGNRVVTAIEILSPANKLSEAGRNAYRKKQRDMISSGVNLVEIDLIRAGAYVLAAPEENVPQEVRAPYRICVFRAAQPFDAEMYRVSLRERLPAIWIPLRASDDDVSLDIQSLVEKSYEGGDYEDLDYSEDPHPPLSEADAAWADELLKRAALR